ncbi:MAG TPA: isochorismatase family cysteine hydrolase [Burkholderiales bacterium]|nr:isochorismatase family cysteine hydrolase [Burkholderiales bacterium]
MKLDAPALLVVDLQNDFCAEEGFLSKARAQGGGPAVRPEDNARVADNIGVLAQATRKAGLPVAWIRSIYDFKYLLPAHIAKRGGKEGLCMEGTWGADFFRLRPAPADLVVDKHTFSGFHGTDLHAKLQARGVRTLIVTGVATNVCVDSTLREGFFLGYHIVLAEDCVASSNAAGHEGTLSTVRVNFGTVLPSAMLLPLLQA